MTLDEFMTSLEEANITWYLEKAYLEGTKCIRAADTNLCPVCALTYKLKGLKFNNVLWYKAAEALGLNTEDSTKIVFTSDNYRFSHLFDVDLHKRLMELVDMNK